MPPAMGICPECGKVRYLYRNHAKRVARLLYPGDHLSAYQCGDYWHLGHPPRRVVRGGGWGGENRLMNEAQHVRRNAAGRALECSACGELVPWLPDVGHHHDCEVTGVDDDDDEEESST